MRWKANIVDGSGREHMEFIATGEERVTVAAGTFRAIKIQGEGKRIAPGRTPDSLTITHWFSPQAKAMVRSIREFRTASGDLIVKIDEELMAVKLK